jgi:invasion protein IalB
MAAIETVTRRDTRPAASSAADGLTSFLNSSAKPDAATARTTTGLKPSPAPAPVPPPSTQQRANNKVVPAWKVGDPCSGNRSLVDMAAQITAAYVANHTVSTAGTTRFIAEVHQALATLPETPEPEPTRRRAWPWVLLSSATALVAIMTIAAGMSTGIFAPSGSDPMPVGGSIRPMETIAGPEEDSAEPFMIGLDSTPAQPLDTPNQIPGNPLTAAQFNDWELICAGITGDDCHLSQRSQPGSAEHQARLSLEAGDGADTLSGSLTLPFNVPLDSRITLQTGAGAIDGPLRFSTCNPEGCVLPISFGGEQVAALSRGMLLQANATSQDGRTVSFLFSLEGFTAAYQHILRSPEEGRGN